MKICEEEQAKLWRLLVQPIYEECCVQPSLRSNDEASSKEDEDVEEDFIVVDAGRQKVELNEKVERGRGNIFEQVQIYFSKVVDEVVGAGYDGLSLNDRRKVRNCKKVFLTGRSVRSKKVEWTEGCEVYNSSSFQKRPVMRRSGALKSKQVGPVPQVAASNLKRLSITFTSSRYLVSGHQVTERTMG